MTAGQRKYEEILRRELRAAAESMQPAPDGLERIRERLTTQIGRASCRERV